MLQSSLLLLSLLLSSYKICKEMIFQAPPTTEYSYITILVNGHIAPMSLPAYIFCRSMGGGALSSGLDNHKQELQGVDPFSPSAQKELQEFDLLREEIDQHKMPAVG